MTSPCLAVGGLAALPPAGAEAAFAPDGFPTLAGFTAEMGSWEAAVARLRAGAGRLEPAAAETAAASR